jgi:hypothetical protein
MTVDSVLIVLLLSFFVVFVISPWLAPGSGRVPTSRKEVHRQIAFIESQLKSRSRGESIDQQASRILRWGQLRMLEQYLKPKNRPQPKQTHSAHFLLAIAVRLLPQSERARYLEEFRAELLDVPRNTRPSHALSLLRAVFVLRLRRGLNRAADADGRRAKS